MKKIFTIAVLGAMTLSASAQDIFNNPNNKAFFGVRAAYELSIPGKMDYDGYKEKVFESGSGFSVGAIYNLPLVANLYLEPGVNFFYNTLGWKDSDGYDNASVRQTGISIPVMVGYHFDFTDNLKVSVFTGPELRIGLSCDEYWKYSDEDGEFKYARSMYGDDRMMNRCEFDWRIGAGVTISDKYYIGVSGGIGISDLAQDEEYDGEKFKTEFRKNNFAVTLGYNF